MTVVHFFLCLSFLCVSLPALEGGGEGRRNGGREREREEGGKEREDYTHEQDDLLCWVEGNEIEC